MTVEQLMAAEAPQALQSEGYLLVSIPEDVSNAVSDTFETAAAFFRQSQQAKEVNKLPADLGYRPYGVEYSASPEHPDRMESFTVRQRMMAASHSFANRNAALLSNEMFRALDHFSLIARALLIGLLRFFGQEADVEAASTLLEWSLLQLNYSRPRLTSEQYINELHEDGCLFTVMSATGPGLEVKVSADAYAPITTAPDQILIMPGEILWLLSGGLIQPCYHRVRTAAHLTERMSLLLFADLDPRLCAPWVVADNNRQIDIGDRVLKNSGRFGLNEW